MSGEGLWVISDVATDGSYVVTIHVGDDLAFTLDDRQAARYATAVAAAAHYAAHDAAVAAQLAAAGLPRELAAQVIVDLRGTRPRLDHEATSPLTFTPGVSAFTGQPFLAFRVTGHRHLDGQLDVGPASGHAANVLRCIAAARSDAAYHQVLTLIGLDHAQARAYVGEAGRHYHPDRPS